MRWHGEKLTTQNATFLAILRATSLCNLVAIAALCDTLQNMSEAKLLAADSFRVAHIPAAGGLAVRALKQHVERFKRNSGRGWVRHHPASARTMELAASEFLRTAIPQIAAAGEGFPRLELWQDSPDTTPRFNLQLRPLPPLGTELAAVTRHVPPQQWANIKGPNIDFYRELQQDAGCEVLLLDVDGSVREGTTTSIVWWDGDCLRTSASTERVHSITEWALGFLLAWAGSPAAAPQLATNETVREAAKYRMAPGTLRPALLSAAALAQTEVWAVNALHGIRPLTQLDGHPLAAPNESRLAVFRKLLDFSWSPVKLDAAGLADNPHQH